MENQGTTALTTPEQERVQYLEACKQASSLNLQLANSFAAIFPAVQAIALFKNALTDEFMQTYIMPLMNTKLGFKTDRTGKPKRNGEVEPLYTIAIVRDCVIDAACLGLRPTGNEFNIISTSMYPTKEGYSALLDMLGVKYYIDYSIDKSQTPNYGEIYCKITYEYRGESKKIFGLTAIVIKNGYSSYDQLRGKAERRAKKTLYEFLTGRDLGEADPEADGNVVIDDATIANNKPKEEQKGQQPTAKKDIREVEFEEVNKNSTPPAEHSHNTPLNDNLKPSYI